MLTVAATYLIARKFRRQHLKKDTSFDSVEHGENVAKAPNLENLVTIIMKIKNKSDYKIEMS